MALRKISVLSTLLLCAFTTQTYAGEIVDGVLMVDGQPFYPLGSWNFDYTTPQDIALLQANFSNRASVGVCARWLV